MRTTYEFHTTATTNTAVRTVRSPPIPDNFAVNVTCLHQSKESTYSVIIKQGKEQRDYVTVNYSVTLKLRVK